MKSAKNLAVLLLILSSSFLFTRCTEASYSFDTPAELLARGTWSVDHYFSGTDQTTAYTNYQFTFSPSGVISCDYSTSSCKGEWEVVKKVASDVLSMQLTTPQTELRELNDQWTITATDAQTITLKNSGALLKLRRL